MTDSGVLVVKADPTIRIRGNVDWMGTSTPIRTAAIDEAGALVVGFTDNHHDFYEATHVQTRAGVEVYDDQEGNEYLASEVAIRLPDGALVDLPAEPLPRAKWFNDSAREDALAEAAEQLIAARREGRDQGRAVAALERALAMGA